MSLAVSLAFLLIGHTHSGYHYTLARGLQIFVLHRTTFYDVVEDAYLYIKMILDKVCSLAKMRWRNITLLFEAGTER